MIELANDQMQIGMVTRNVEAMVKFYGETLGLTLQQRVDLPQVGALYFFELGSNIIKFLVPEVAVEQDDHVGAPQAANGLRYWTVQVNNLQALVETIKQAGLTPLTEITEVGELRFVIVPDPDGNCIEFLEAV